MSWAANRKTTKMEDIAYCLLGMFDIQMPLMYGERKKAFRRLQKNLFLQVGYGQYESDGLVLYGCLCDSGTNLTAETRRVEVKSEYKYSVSDVDIGNLLLSTHSSWLFGFSFQQI
jgi:hypothetical protein